MPKGAVWNTPMVSRVSMISMVPRVSTMLERMLDEMDDRCWPLFFGSPLNGKPLAMVESSGQVDDAAHLEVARWSPTYQWRAVW